MKKSIICGFAIALLATGCKKEEKKEEETCTTCSTDEYLFVSNEGKFPESGSITKINLSKGSIEKDFYSTNNEGAELGNTVQSVFINGSNGYALVSGADQVVIFNPITGEHKSALDISYPRYMIKHGEFGYISSGKYEGKISKINLSTNSVVDTISTGNGPEKMVIANDQLIVGNSGGWSNDSTITVVDINTLTVDTTIHLGPRIKGVEKDENGKVWALSSVYYGGTNNAKLFKLNPTDWTIEEEFEISSSNESVNDFDFSNDQESIFYFTAEGTFKLATAATAAPSLPIISGGNWYGIQSHPTEDKIYLFNNGGFVSNGFVNEYNFSGDSLRTFETGISANGGFIQ